MQNQMMPKINLLKMPDPAARTQKYVNMMNATKQQEAAEQTLKIQQERAAREEELQVPALATAKTEADIKKLDFMMQFYKATANDIANSSTPDEVVARAERLKQQFPVPELQARIDETVNSLVSDPSRFEENRKRILTRTLDAKDQFAVNHSDIFDMDGNLYTKRTSPIGAFETEITPGLETDPSVTSAPRAETPRTPVVSPPAAAPRTPTAAPQPTPSGPVPTGKFGATQVVPEASVPLTPYQQDHIRRMQEDLGMTNTPASFTRGGMATPTAGQMSPDMVPAILDSAINTGVMAQIDLDQMLAMSPPQARQGIMDVIRSSNISLQADAPSLAASAMPQQQPMAPNPVQRPQSQFADMRGPAPQASFADLGGQPEMQNTMAQYQVGRQIKGRNPSMSPYPGSAQVPLSRVAGEAEARRETPAQITQRKNAELAATEAFEESNKDKQINRKVQEVFATKRAEKDADFLETYTDTVSKSRATLNALDQMIGDARIERDRIVIPKGGRRPHGGFEGVVGAGIPGVRFIPGTQAAGFDALLEQVQGGAFLKAFNDLRGGGAITQVEGEKATTALTRVRRAQSEIEFVKAAREFVEILRNGIKNADKRYARLTGEAPPAAAPPRKTPTKGSDGWGKAKVVGN
jgi:hypothetical protein